MKKALAIGALVATGLGVALVTSQTTPPASTCARVVACAMRIDPASAGPTLARKYADAGDLPECARTLEAMRCAPQCVDGPLPPECQPQ